MFAKQILLSFKFHLCGMQLMTNNSCSYNHIQKEEVLQEGFKKMGKLCFLEKIQREKKHLKYVTLHPVLPIGTVMAIFCTLVLNWPLFSLFQQVIM